MHKELEKLIISGALTSKMALLAQEFIDSYMEAAQQNQDQQINYRGLTETLIACIAKQLKDPYVFPVYHEKITAPFNYAQFSKDFIAPMIEEESSTIEGIENIDKLSSLIALGENAVILYNHQTEPDPQIIALMLEKRWKALTESMIFIAGHRVTKDPLAVPFTMGCNILRVYSKKHLDNPPEEKEKKILHNRRATAKMQELLNKGGACILIAPSGGRDRADETGKIVLAPFDAQSIEMLYLTAKRAKKKTTFFPLALSSYALLPPPGPREKELGEKRIIKRSPIHISLGAPLDMEGLADQSLDKKLMRQQRAEGIFNLIKKNTDKYFS